MNRVSIGSDDGLSPTRRQAFVWASAGLLSIGTDFNLYFVLIISSWCRVYASVNQVSIGSDDGLSPIRARPLSGPVLGYCQLEQVSDCILF